METSTLLVIIALNLVTAVLYLLCFLPALRAKLIAHGHNPLLAFLSLVPVVFIGVLIWFVMTPATPNHGMDCKA